MGAIENGNLPAVGAALAILGALAGFASSNSSLFQG